MHVTLNQKKIFVTGGAGFIGSHFVDNVSNQGCAITIYDNFSTGKEINLERVKSSNNVRIICGDINDIKKLKRSINGHDVVFHFAAHTDTERSYIDKSADMRDGTLGTFHLLGVMQELGINDLVFPSSQLVYGEMNRVLNETTGPLSPISLYGASKLACEALISAFSHLFNIRATVLRLGNIMGDRMWRGIVYDFIKKLRKNPQELKILGDGKQARNYLLINDCIKGILKAYKDETMSNDRLFLLGNSDVINAYEVAEIVIDEMRLSDIAILRYEGSQYGWKGDIPTIRIDTSKIESLGWKPTKDSKEVIRECTRRLLK